MRPAPATLWRRPGCVGVVGVVAVAWAACAGFAEARATADAATPPVDGALAGEASQLDSVALRDDTGRAVRLRELLARARFTVLVFGSTRCHCFVAHRRVLEELAGRFGARSVGFVIVDAEPPAPDEPGRHDGLALSGTERFDDDHARLARALGVTYASEAVVVSAAGAIVYRGGIDSARTAVGPTAVPYLRRALEQALAGDRPAPARTKALGCALRRW